MKKLIMLSGGLDSTALALKTIDEDASCKLGGIFFDVGQLSATRQEAAVRRMASHLDMPVEYVDLKGMAKLFLAKYEPPHPMVAEQFFSSCKIITIASLYAISVGASRLLYAATSDDTNRASYLPEMLQSITKTVQLNSGVSNFDIETPIIQESNGAALKIANKLWSGPEDLFTWSCHWGGLFHCGECSGCQVRKNRFIEARLSDVTRYGPGW